MRNLKHYIIASHIVKENFLLGYVKLAQKVFRSLRWNNSENRVNHVKNSARTVQKKLFSKGGQAANQAFSAAANP